MIKWLKIDLWCCCIHSPVNWVCFKINLWGYLFFLPHFPQTFPSNDVNRQFLKHMYIYIYVIIGWTISHIHPNFKNCLDHVAREKRWTLIKLTLLTLYPHYITIVSPIIWFYSPTYKALELADPISPRFSRVFPLETEKLWMIPGSLGENHQFWAIYPLVN